MYPDISDGIVLTGFSMNGSFVGFFAAGADWQQANLNQPFRLGNSPTNNALNILNTDGLDLSNGTIVAILNYFGLTDPVAGLGPEMPRVPYVNGYLVNSNANSNQYNFFLPPFFDTQLLYAGELTKQPVSVGELLTLGSVPMVNHFAGPVLIITGCKFRSMCS